VRTVFADRVYSQSHTSFLKGLGLYTQRGFAGNEGKSKGKNLRAGPPAGLGRNLQGLAAIKTIVNDSIVNDSILERRRKLATSRNFRGARRNADFGSSGGEYAGLGRRIPGYL
jgi:hypothetical protein